MARTDVVGLPDGERIEDVDVSEEMQGSFLEYAYSVIYSRALPDARDGLKPVQRRILYQMAEMGLRPDRGHVKSARVTGEVMGKLHPHGDGAIYDALVRMAQPFTMRVPLVDGHGNFGSLDDGPAAARYTEARLAEPSMAMTEGLGEDVVDFVPNYDNQIMQPGVLPAAFPNLLVNGASGIAVGMATNMAPHNLGEVVEAAKHLLMNPQASLEELMEFVPGPDLPSGGTIVGLSGVRDAYATGRGSFRTRAKVSVENLTPRKVGLVVTELPYLVGPERVIEKIKDGVQSKKLVGISDVNDLTDRNHGLRLVIGIKSGFNPTAVLEQLYKHTPLEDGFGINNVALVGGSPRTLGLRELLDVYVQHRLDVVTRRSQYRLARRKERLHLVEGLLIAILDIDEVIQVIRTSDDSEAARNRLRDVFDLSEVQAEYILELRLRRLTKFSRMELEAERDQLLADIAALEELLASDERLRAQVALELTEVSDKFATPRRTLLTEADAPVKGGRKAAVDPESLQIADSPCRVLLSTTGRLIRVDIPTSELGIVRVPKRSKHDAVRSAVVSTVRGQIGAITSTGRVLRLSPVDVPAVPPAAVRLDAGVRVTDFLALTKGETVVAIVDLSGASSDSLAIGTAHGVVKRVVAGAWPDKPEFVAIGLKPGDQVVGAAQAPESDDLVFISSNAQLLRFPASVVRAQGLPAGGVAGMALADGASVIWFGSVARSDDAVVATVSTTSTALPGTDAGRAKVSALSEFPAKGRATQGVRAHAFLKGEDGLTVGWAGIAPPHAVGTDGAARTLPDWLSKRDGSGAPLEAVIGSIGGSAATLDGTAGEA
ncbi:DNA topoisomerase (ATP-hydrolyzing) subunit A [Curtobacterium flaccumfaciens]|uniref:DNA gyrase/topoisomerase IV subunit A n=1 Tax=Curtobacterium flaccumfaciens TaxID=2035 RepID=UPI000FFEB24B|nr:DNA topoisomerase (ATP-hydrolyzing) [Curtobacterium flaccumfaciens]MBT1683515.1 DNA topoisomerase IV subunit A [Curtobacterium flaccumfaciens pv. flaccumfaciens]MCS0646342.1 DNA topoisomerase 4 subunit A [Curtobacterium flaccumfaciens pv. flaccumfaciens]MCS6526283.1 DNA topoisomerase 4 subunit A [Curtobacterium flaccumfaciens pv. flaccumfaciens]MCS6528363.1 DNA topoisomerase 4 subunit A [Curtobacterium flaccumfaciens pv. flaccumfaciens]NUU11728.1 DNA topoisomerase 4 subunit A [Curtobacteriu